MMKHRGEIVEKAIRNSGSKITDVANAIGYTRKSLYDFFDNPNLSLDIIVEIGKVIKYDFRKDLPELFIPDPGQQVVNDPSETYGTLSECLKEKNMWRDKYYAVLEENNQLQKQLNQKK